VAALCKPRDYELAKPKWCRRLSKSARNNRLRLARPDSVPPSISFVHAESHIRSHVLASAAVFDAVTEVHLIQIR
jgi:hypothetical protein